MTDQVREIDNAILSVMEEVGYVQKERSDKLSYTFTSEKGLIQALRPAMLRHKIYARVLEIKETRRESYTTTKGTQMVSTLLVGVVRFTHAPSGTSIDVWATGEGADSGDKSANKAMTGMYKYALVKTFMIESGDDPDATSSEDQERLIQDAIAFRKDIKDIFVSKPELQEKFKETMVELGYNNETTDVELMKKVIKQLKEIKGE